MIARYCLSDQGPSVSASDRLRRPCHDVCRDRRCQQPHCDSCVRAVHEPDGRYPERDDDRDNCSRLRLHGETVARPPVTHDPAKDSILHQPPIESIGRLGEEKGREKDRPRRRNARNDNADECNANPEPPEGHEDETERTIANDDHHLRLENPSPDSVSAVELAHA